MGKNSLLPNAWNMTPENVVIFFDGNKANPYTKFKWFFCNMTPYFDCSITNAWNMTPGNDTMVLNGKKQTRIRSLSDLKFFNMTPYFMGVWLTLEIRSLVWCHHRFKRKKSKPICEVLVILFFIIWYLRNRDKNSLWKLVFHFSCILRRQRK